MSAERRPATESGGAALPDFLRALERRMEARPRTTPLPPAGLAGLREVTDTTGLVERFAASAAAAGMRVQVVAADAVVGVVCEILRGCAAKQVVVEPQTDSALSAERTAALRGTLAEAGIATTDRRDDETLFSTDAAVTGATAAIAETGTIVCPSGAETARGATLIPPRHVALVGESQIVGDLFDYFERGMGAGPLPANVNLITGPSKTADIEGILVTGVHGPGEVHVVVVRG